MIRTIIFLLLYFLSINVFSQATTKITRHREQVWLVYFNQTRVSNKFGYWVDLQYRQTDNFVDRPFQFIFRPAITYFIKDNLRFNVGCALIENFPAKGLTSTRPEYRGWQQIWWNQKYNGLTTLQWLRLEQRFNRKIANDVLLDDYNFNYRLRYNMSFFIPFKGKEILPKTSFGILMNEVFLNFGDNIIYNTFDQNRFFAGVGYQFTKQLNAQLGYLNIYQQESSGNSYISSNAIRLSIFHTLDFRKDPVN